MQDSTINLSSERLLEAEKKALANLLGRQKPKGDFEGEMVWCTMILAQAVIVRTIVGRPYSADDRSQILKHFAVTQAGDGSWGMHPESPGYVFFTTLSYIALRFLDVPAEDPVAKKALEWIHRQPVGVEGIPTWGKFWLAILGLYEYRGLNAIPPELFLLPEWLPFHPRRFYCHTRLIYLGLAYISGRRFVADLPKALIESLRSELYPTPYTSIQFDRLRHTIANSDVYVPISPLLRVIYDGLAIFERVHSKAYRQKALDFCLNRIEYEQKTTRYQGISPVNGLLNTLALFVQNPEHPELEASLQGVEAWRWEDEEEGLRYVGARSNTWDTGFILQAIAQVKDPEPATVDAMGKAIEFLDHAQMREELPNHSAYWRDSAVGGWCFSDGVHRWPVSDCTAEAISGILSIEDHPAYRSLPRYNPEFLRQGIQFILSRQNADGGFGTYERRRAGKLLEWVNPSEMFGQCMTELSYIECTASSLDAISHFRAHDPTFENEKLDKAAARAIKLLRDAQKNDGSWQGFWGINYTYATFHAVRALRLAGAPRDDEALQRAVLFLKSKQREDGGWSEHYTSCLEERYIEHPETQVVMTSWALLALLEVAEPTDPAIERGILWLLSQQKADGSWPMQAVNGVFFGAAMLDYRLYHSYFPVWAITRYNHNIRGV
jgi:2,3-oxidosqualene cyclase